MRDFRRRCRGFGIPRGDPQHHPCRRLRRDRVDDDAGRLASGRWLPQSTRCSAGGIVAYGSITIAKGISAGYLPQDGLTLSGQTVFAECMSVFDELRDMEREMEDLTRRMSEIDPASMEYGEVADRFHRIEGTPAT